MRASFPPSASAPPSRVGSSDIASAQRNAPPTPRGQTRAPRLDRYEIVDEIARGGMGTVYRAKHRHGGAVCALKYVDVSGREHGDAVLLGLEREYRTLRGLEHPRIIRVFDYGVTDLGAYYTMELLEGRDMRRCAPLPWREVCQYLRDVATCLSLLHARRMIHRDLSPGNVKLTGDGHCKLIDFGALAEFGHTDAVVGTPPFIAPEVLSHGRLDQRVDLYALGALAYYCLTGQYAYPARDIASLPTAWATSPAPPSSVVADVPPALDELVMSLLRENPLARPASAAEVITHLDVIGELPPEDDVAQRTLTRSFLYAPRYVGREPELERFGVDVRALVEGARGQALRVIAPAGAGRTRFLDELAIRAELVGAVVVRADAGAQRGRYGVVRALSAALLDALPEAARRHGRGHRAALRALDPAIEARVLSHYASEHGHEVAHTPSEPFTFASPSTRRGVQAPARARVDLPHGAEQWFIDVSRERPLVVLVDNVECADDASLGSLIGLARAASDERIVLVVSELASDEKRPLGLATLASASRELRLEHLSRAHFASLLHSLFGEAPRVERLSDWLYEQTVGSPLHGLDVIRHLVDQRVIRHERGEWVLPTTRPDTRVCAELEDALARRVDALSAEAHELAQSLSLQTTDPSLALCRRMVGQGSQRAVMDLLDELSAADVMHRDQEHLVFSSEVLRKTILKRMKPATRRRSHLRLGQALASLATPDQPAILLEAGLHLIRGGDEMRGADMIAEVTQDSVSCNLLVANLFPIGVPAEAALKVYRAARKSIRERSPLLSALAQAGYYEHYQWADKYGDDALDAAEQLSGLGLARRLRPLVGGYIAIALALGIACIIHYLAPRKARGGSFMDLLIQTCCTVTALSGLAAITLDAERCERVARVLSPASVLPRRIAITSIHEFCEGLQHVAREHPAQAFAKFQRLSEYFADPDYHWFMPAKANSVYFAASHFARGVFALLRADGKEALESANALERSGLPLYLMIANQIRYLYHFLRGEPDMAQVHRARVELHAARVGYAWQVELWEPAALLAHYVATDDVVELRRVAHRLADVAEDVGPLWRYRELAHLAAEMHKRTPDLARRFTYEIADVKARSFVGWSTSLAAAAKYHNRNADFDRALELVQIALASMTDEDRAYVVIFLQVDIQAAVAEAGLGQVDAALARLQRVLTLHAASENPLVLGLLHEARARIGHQAGRRLVYLESLRACTRYLRATGVPTMVAAVERLARLGEEPALLCTHSMAEDIDTV